MATTHNKTAYDLAQDELNRVQSRLRRIGRSDLVTSPAPAGQVLGASATAGLNAAQIGGASGVGFEDPEDQAAISGQVRETLASGAPKAVAGDRVSGEQASALLRRSGLGGMLDGAQFAGLSYGEAAQQIAAERGKRLGQVSANTSFTFNPETVSGTKKAVDRLNVTLTDIMNDPFTSKGSRQDKTRAALDASAGEIAKLFGSPEQLREALQVSPELGQTLQAFTAAGGRVEDINTRIPSQPQQNVQSTGEYLANLTNPQANPEAEARAVDELVPERQVAQAEIARQARIPAELVSVYFGTEDQVGILEQRRREAQEEKRIIEERERDEKESLRSKAQLAVAKEKAEVKLQKARIEENRLAAKNYMTGMLAKLGALKTTGAAPVALQTLETRYEQQVQQLEFGYKFASRTIEIQLTDALNAVENDTDELVLKLEQDLTKDYETIAKEIMKAEQAAEKEVFRLTEKYATQLRSRTTVHTNALKREAEKYAKEFLKTAGGGVNPAQLAGVVGGVQYDEGQYVPKKGVALPDGSFTRLSLTPTQEREVGSVNVRGLDGIRYFLALPAAFRKELIQTRVGAGDSVSLRRLQDAYAAWQAAQAEPRQSTTGSGGGGSGFKPVFQ